MIQLRTHAVVLPMNYFANIKCGTNQYDTSKYLTACNLSCEQTMLSWHTHASIAKWQPATYQSITLLFTFMELLPTSTYSYPSQNNIVAGFTAQPYTRLVEYFTLITCHYSYKMMLNTPGSCPFSEILKGEHTLKLCNYLSYSGK